jgi:hypothetical protein
MTHYVTGNLRLRAGDDLSSVVVALLPKYTALRIVETGKNATIDGITAPWVKVTSQTNYTGWCFSGYVKPIENDVAQDIAVSFAQRQDGTYPGKFRGESTGIGVTSIDAVKAATGYYIQQNPRSFQGDGHQPEILTLSVENGKVYIREVDVLNGEKITRKEIQLQFDEKTYAHGDSRLELLDSGSVQIAYFENVPKENNWRYESYTFAGKLNQPMPENVIRLTGDYLQTFAGRYAFDSYKIIISENMNAHIDEAKKNIIEIKYNQKRKCLTVSVHHLLFYEKGGGSYDFDFVETTAEEPFSWRYGIGNGFSEERFYFYKGGIAFAYEYTFSDPSSNNEGHLKYCVFFKKAKK